MSNHDDIFAADVLTPEQQTRLLKAIYKALAGDPLDSDEPGIVRRVEEHHIEIHGSKKTNTVGIKSKVETLWEGRIKIMAICGAIAFVIGILSWLLPIYLGRH